MNKAFSIMGNVFNRIIVSMVVGCIFVSQACQEESASVEVPEDSEWIRLTIPDAREAYAVFGDIDQTLTVTTVGKAYFTTDQGKTWQISRDFRGVVFGLYYVQDTLFALHGHNQNSLEEQTFASLAQHYSLDTGKTWYDYRNRRRHDLRQPLGVDTTSAGNIYQIKGNVAPDGYVNPSEILKLNSQDSLAFSFPYAHRLNNLYLDTNDRLYIAAAGDRHNEEDNTLFCCFDAFVYVSKKPLP